MSISAKIILDSITSEGVRVTTFELRYPRYIHADLLTHRVFSRNASSSRAKPLKAFLSEELVYPITYGGNIPGMQAGDELTGIRKFLVKSIWGATAKINGYSATLMSKLGLHKQWVNRPIEWFTHINVLVTATDYNNFFALRYHKDAQPELTELARQMYELYSNSKPLFMSPNGWHLPYVNTSDLLNAERLVEDGFYSTDKPHKLIGDLVVALLIRVSVARCARVSYKSHDGKDTTVEQDLILYARLLASVPLHASPAEHQCTPDYTKSIVINDEWTEVWSQPEYHGNLHGLIQYRKLLDGEYQKDFSPPV